MSDATPTPSGPTLTPGTWTIEPAHSEVGFTVRHLGLSKVRGRFNEFAGTATIADDLTTSRIEAEIQLASVDTNNETRDGHLRGTDFFNTETHPVMRFVSTSIDRTGDSGVIHGDLTINGHTLPVDLDCEFNGVAVDAYNTTRAGFSATTSIDRKDFGIDFDVPLSADAVLIGNKVTIELEIQLVPAG